MTTFLVRLTGPTEDRFRERHAALLRRSVHPVEVIGMGKDLFRLIVDPEQAGWVRKALLEVQMWGADVDED